MPPSTADLFDPSRLQIKLGSYATGSASLLADPSLLPRVQEYRRQANSRMYPLEPDDLLHKIPPGELHVSRKLDGEFNVLVARGGQVFSLNPGGTLRIGMPWLQEAARILQQAGVDEAVLAGELYLRRADGRRARVHDIVSVARNPNSLDELDQVAFAVFDVLSLDGDEYGPDKSFRERWEWIAKTFGEREGRVHAVEACWVSQPEDVRAKFQQWVEEQGGEGLVVRSETGGDFKIKPRHNLDAVVLGFTESTDDRQGLLHDLLLGIRRHDGTYQVLCRVGGGLSDQQRRDLLSDLRDRVAESEYAEVNSDRVAYQMVCPELVVEISYLDLVSQTTRGGPINRMVLEFDSDHAPRYKVVRRLPLVAVISPQFVRLRDDKQADTSDVRIDQVSDRVDLTMVDADARQLRLPSSELIQREVYVKEQKGQTMVRKFVMWKTNKSQQSDEYPEYVVHYTDFSPNRKDPLDREIRISNSQAQIEMLWNELKQSNIKSGWKLAEVAAAASDASLQDSPAGESPAARMPRKRKMAASERTSKRTQRKKKSS